MLSKKLLAFAASAAFAASVLIPGMAFASTFDDVPADHWAETSGIIDKAVDRGLIKGYSGSNDFGPDDKIKRADVIVILMRGAEVDEKDYSSQNETSWNDVPSTYYTPALNWAYENSILNKTQASVRPSDPITRQELCCVLANYAEQQQRSIESDADRLYKYPDADQIAGWAKDPVSYATEQGIVGGASTLNPAGNATRAETTKMLLVFLDGGDEQPALYKSHFIDVGQGDSTFIELPNHQSMLIDAGTAGAAERVVAYIQSKGYSTIDHLVATHPDADHIGGMAEVINSFNIGKVYAPDYISTTKTYENFLDALANKGLRIDVLKGERVLFNDGTLKCTAFAPADPADSNGSSIVLKNSYEQKSYLYPGDQDSSTLEKIATPTDVLKVSHHGSDTGTSDKLISLLNPSFAVISCGANNSYGHPTSNVLNSLKNCNLYRTDKQGSISSFSDGGSIWFNTSRYAEPAPAPTPEPAPAPEQPSNPGGSQAGSQQPSNPVTSTVYITPSGSKYHRQNCSTLKNSKTIYAVSLSEALNRGLGACKVCRP